MKRSSGFATFLNAVRKRATLGTLAFLSLTFFLGLTLGLPIMAALAEPPIAEIRVRLFGQPCILAGPLPETSLKNIHSISPEQLPAPESITAVKQALETLRKSAAVPHALDTYREQLQKRLASLLVFFEGVKDLKKSGKADSLLKNLKAHLSEKRVKELEPLARKLESRAPDPAASSQLHDLFLESLPTDPEEEFHRAIRQIRVNYLCSFEELGEEPGEEPGGT